MTLYNLVLFAHIIGTLILFMAVAVESLCLHHLRRAATTDQLREWGSLTKTIQKPLPLSTVFILGSGLYMTLTAWDLTVPWIGLSLAVVVVMTVVGGAVNSRRLDAIAAAAEKASPGAIPPDLARRIQDPVLLASINTLTALGFGVVFLKVARPDLVGAVAVLAVAVVLGVLSAGLASRGENVSTEVMTRDVAKRAA